MLNMALLKETLSYDQETGLFIRIKRTSNCIKANEVACRLNSFNKYRQVAFMGKTYQAHRLAWFYVHGVFPCGQIDHINRNKSDNRLVNLRDCSISENKQNSGLYKSNKCSIPTLHFPCDRNAHLRYKRNELMLSVIDISDNGN